MAPRRMFGRALAVALAAHAAGAAATYLRPRATTSEAPSAAPFDLSLEEPAPEPTPPLEPEAPRAPTEAAPSGRARTTSAASALRAAGAHDTPSTDEGAGTGALPSSAREASGEPGWTLAGIAAPRVDVGLERRPIAAPPPVDEARAASDELNRGLREALAVHDREIGLGSGGPIVHAAHSAVAASLAPVEGSADIEVSVDGTGRATAVRLVGSSSHEREWTDAAKAILEALDGKPIRVARGSRGVTVKVHVRSRMQTASGAAPSKLPTSARVALFPLKVLTGNFDVTDLDQKPARAIAVWVVEESLR